MFASIFTQAIPDVVITYAAKTPGGFTAAGKSPAGLEYIQQASAELKTFLPNLEVPKQGAPLVVSQADMEVDVTSTKLYAVSDALANNARAQGLVVTFENPIDQLQ